MCRSNPALKFGADIIADLVAAALNPVGGQSNFRIWGLVHPYHVHTYAINIGLKGL